jgi:hypothetical protein
MIWIMRYQFSFWLIRSGSRLKLCAAIPRRNPVDPDKTEEGSVAIFASPGSFLSRLQTTIVEQAKVDEIKTVVVKAIGTLDQVFTTDSIELRPEQLATLGFTGIANSIQN